MKTRNGSRMAYWSNCQIWNLFFLILNLQMKSYIGHIVSEVPKTKFYKGTKNIFYSPLLGPH